MINAKSDINLTREDGPHAKVSTLSDSDEHTVEDPWEELEKIYQMSNAQIKII